MANEGSEVERTILWRNKNKLYSQKALERALELLDLTIASPLNRKRLRELTRIREVLVDYFLGVNDWVRTNTVYALNVVPPAYWATRAAWTGLAYVNQRVLPTTEAEDPTIKR